MAGSVAFLAVAILLAWLCVTRRRHGDERSTRDFFDYRVRSQLGDPPEPRVLSWDPTPMDSTPRDTELWPQPSNSNLTDSASNPGTVLTPQRRGTTGRTYRVANDTASTESQPAGRVLPTPPMSQIMREQKSFLGMQPPSDPSTSQDIHTLAREVAAVMMQNTLDSRSRAADDVASSAPPSYAHHHSS